MERPTGCSLSGLKSKTKRSIPAQSVSNIVSAMVPNFKFEDEPMSIEGNRGLHQWQHPVLIRQILYDDDGQIIVDEETKEQDCFVLYQV